MATWSPSSRRSPRSGRAGSTAGSWCSSPPCSSTSPATTATSRSTPSSGWRPTDNWLRIGTKASGSAWTRSAMCASWRTSGRAGRPRGAFGSASPTDRRGRMRLLVTGHNGYIGSIMVPVLQAVGHDVVGLDTFFFDDCVLGEEPDFIPSIRKDIRDITVSDLNGFEAIVHLAALCNDPLGDLNPDWTYDINHRASVHLARTAKAAGVKRFVFSSSCSMYGDGWKDELNEEAPLRPLTPYAVSKV